MFITKIYKVPWNQKDLGSFAIFAELWGHEAHLGELQTAGPSKHPD